MDGNQLKLKTKRLIIIPLTNEQFDMLLNAPEGLKFELSLANAPTPLTGDTREAMQGLYALAAEHPYNYPWYSSWQILLREGHKPVGSACFMGVPDLEGNVEIGYGTDEEFRCRGYMKEAVAAIIEWALSRGDVNSVLAKTEPDNIASQKVLTACGFEKCNEENGLVVYTKTAEPQKAMKLLPMGVCLGTCVGIVIGKVFFEETTIGLAIGAVAGAALGKIGDTLADKRKAAKE